MNNETIIGLVVGAVVLIGVVKWFFESPAAAVASSTSKSKEEIIQLLEDQGYRVKEIDWEDGVYEVEAYQNGKELEIKIDNMGNIINIKYEN